jgi:hypothetical protein
MRPRLDVRLAVDAAADRLVQQRGSFTTRDVAHLAQVGFEKARLTVKDSIRAGELRVVGTVRLPGINRPVNLLSRPKQASEGPGADLLRLLRSWVEFP